MQFRWNLIRVCEGARRQDRSQFGDVGQLRRGHAQVLDAAGGQHRLANLQAAPGSWSVTIQIDGQKNAAVGVTHGEGHVTRSQQGVPVAGLRGIVRLAKAHQGQLGNDEMPGKCVAKVAIQAALVRAKKRTSCNRPLLWQRGGGVRPPRPGAQQTAQQQSRKARQDQVGEVESRVHEGDVNQATAARRNFGRAASVTVAGFPKSSS